MSDVEKTATISTCGHYRYALGRRWDDRPILGWIMLNPSTADANFDDPTIRKCVGFAKQWRFGGIAVRNLFALRSTDPTKLRQVFNPVGYSNESHLADLARLAVMTIAAWGDLHGWHTGNVVAENVKQIFKGKTLMCLHRTKHGYPAHPLYQPYSRDLIPLTAPAAPHG